MELAQEKKVIRRKKGLGHGRVAPLHIIIEDEIMTKSVINNLNDKALGPDLETKATIPSVHQESQNNSINNQYRLKICRFSPWRRSLKKLTRSAQTVIIQVKCHRKKSSQCRREVKSKAYSPFK